MIMCDDCQARPAAFAVSKESDGEWSFVCTYCDLYIYFCRSCDETHADYLPGQPERCHHCQSSSINHEARGYGRTYDVPLESILLNPEERITHISYKTWFNPANFQRQILDVIKAQYDISAYT